MIPESTPQNHLCVTSSDDVIKIAEPLFKITGLNYFGYGRYFGKLGFTLHTSIPFYSSFLENKKPFIDYSPRNGTYFWDDFQNEQEIIATRALDFGNGILIVKHHRTYSETFAFSAPPNYPKIMSFYFNHEELLNKFCLYFKEKAHKLINHANQNAILLPDYMMENRNQTLDDLNLKNLNNSLSVKKFYINDEYNGIRLSKREIQCLVLYLKGKTTVQIGNQFNLRKSTVDNFLFTLKKKFKCRKRSELIELFWNLGILKSNGWFDI